MSESIPAPHPYKGNPDRTFWRNAVGGKNAMEISEWYQKKFPISKKSIAAAGSCFAQHIGRNLKAKGFKFVDTEPAPNSLKRTSHLDYGYGMYSARYGNVYTSRQLLQLAQQAMGEFTPEEKFWKQGDGYVDPFRPTIELNPFAHPDEVAACREYHLKCVREIFTKADVFVFTLGLTETWMSTHDGAVYPVAPGVSGGNFNRQDYRFVNLTCRDIVSDMKKFFSIARNINGQMKFILTVSPVPLMATATDQNVIVASSYSKSVLRAAAGELAATLRFVDYFPSYEIISSHVMHGQFYNPDLRTVADHGVNHVMNQFFKQHPPPNNKANKARQNSNDSAPAHPDDIMCDEELLAEFGGQP